MEKVTKVSGKEYEQRVKLTSYDVDTDNRLKMSTLFRYCQELSGEHLEVQGLSYEKMKDDGLVFLFTRAEVQINRMPGHGETVRFVTRPVGTSGSQFYREFEVLLEEERLLYVLQASVCADPNTHKLLRPKKFFEYGVYQGELKSTLEKFTLPENMQEIGRREVRYSDLDYNGHLNNAVYADIFYDYLPGGIYGRPLSMFQIHYAKECRRGDVLTLWAGEKDGLVFLRGDNEGGLSFECCAGFQKENP